MSGFRLMSKTMFLGWGHIFFAFVFFFIFAVVSEKPATFFGVRDKLASNPTVNRVAKCV